MIVGYIGNMGGGKTLTMVKDAYEKYRLGYTIYSNFHLEFPYKELNFEQLVLYAKDSQNFDKCVFLIDEAHIFIDARKSMTKENRLISYLILQSRKKGMDIYYSTQDFMSVEIRLRRHTDVIIRCRSYDYKQKKVIFNVIEIKKMEGVHTTKRMFIGDEYFTLYDTRQVVWL